MTTILLAVAFACLTYSGAMLAISNGELRVKNDNLRSDNKILRTRLEESKATAKAYDDAAAKHNARADKAERELEAARAKLAKFDRKRGAGGKFTGMP